MNNCCWNKWFDKIHLWLGYRLCNILCGETFLITSAESFILNGFESQFLSGSSFVFGEATSLFFSLSGQHFLDWNLNLLFLLVQYFFSLAATHWIDIACTSGIGQTDSNCSFNTIHCSCNMVTYFSHTSHKRTIASPYFCCLFKYYSKFVERILYWLRFFTFYSDDVVFTSWKIMLLQRLKPSWFIVTVCFIIFIVTKVFTT